MSIEWHPRRAACCRLGRKASTRQQVPSRARAHTRFHLRPNRSRVTMKTRQVSVSTRVAR